VIGVSLNLMADAVFKREQTTVKPFEKSTALVVTGVFQISRHPMYLGMVLILLGIAILMGTLTPLIVVVIFGILMELVFVRAEGVGFRESRREHARRAVWSNMACLQEAGKKVGLKSLKACYEMSACGRSRPSRVALFCLI
jgi:steroid 5-alpha reductase family enzyme